MGAVGRGEGIEKNRVSLNVGATELGDGLAGVADEQAGLDGVTIEGFGVGEVGQRLADGFRPRAEEVGGDRSLGDIAIGFETVPVNATLGVCLPNRRERGGGVIAQTVADIDQGKLRSMGRTFGKAGNLDEFSVSFLVCAKVAMKELVKFAGKESFRPVGGGFEAKAIGVGLMVGLTGGVGHCGSM